MAKLVINHKDEITVLFCYIITPPGWFKECVTLVENTILNIFKIFLVVHVCTVFFVQRKCSKIFAIFQILLTTEYQIEVCKILMVIKHQIFVFAQFGKFVSVETEICQPSYLCMFLTYTFCNKHTCIKDTHKYKFTSTVIHIICVFHGVSCKIQNENSFKILEFKYVHECYHALSKFTSSS